MLNYQKKKKTFSEIPLCIFFFFFNENEWIKNCIIHAQSVSVPVQGQKNATI